MIHASQPIKQIRKQTQLVSLIVITLRFILISSTLSFICMTQLKSQDTLLIFVDQTRNGNGTFAFENGLKNLQDALDMADLPDHVDKIVEIRVADGTYRPTDLIDPLDTDEREKTFHVNRNVIIRGGYAGAFNSGYDPELYPTILSGNIGSVVDHADNAYHVLLLSDADDPVLDTLFIDGVTIQDGNANGGPANIFQEGGGIWNTRNLKLSRVTITNNVAASDGGGISNSGTLILEKSKIFTNQSEGGGGMMNRGQTFIFSSEIKGNYANGGSNGIGGGFNNESGSSLTFINSIISGNKADRWGGGVLNEGFITFVNTTITGNEAAELGSGIENSFGTSIFKNTIVANNEVNTDQTADIFNGPNQFDISGSIQDDGGNLIGDTSGVSNLFNLSTEKGSLENPLDPMFVSNAPTTPTVLGDFRLVVSSPAIDAGINTHLPNDVILDIYGNPRIENGTVDIGAAEGGQIICNYQGDQVREFSTYFYDQSLATRDGIWSHSYTFVEEASSLSLYSDQGLEFNMDFTVLAGSTLLADIADCVAANIQDRLDHGIHPYQIFLEGNPIDSLIGKFAQGGIIFYMDANGFGLVAMPENLENISGVSWGCIGNLVGAGGVGIRTGSSNTQNIVQNCADSPIAAERCDDLVANGYDDWFLPSRDELIAMYNNIGPGASGANQNIGDFANTAYISSSETNADIARTVQFFNNGHPSATFKSQQVNAIRAARSFTAVTFYLDQGVSFITMIERNLATIEDLLNEGISFQELLDGGIQLTEILNAGYDIQDLLSDGTLPVSIINAGADTSDFMNLTYCGGIIFYMKSDGTGLVAAEFDNPEPAGLSWGCQNLNVTGAMGTGIGTGTSNTSAIINANCADPSFAANYCNDLQIGAFDDWFLPSSSELQAIYDNIRVDNNFEESLYWSSTQSGTSTQAIALDFRFGNQGSITKNASYKVRAVRAF